MEIKEDSEIGVTLVKSASATGLQDLVPAV